MFTSEKNCCQEQKTVVTTTMKQTVHEYTGSFRLRAKNAEIIFVILITSFPCCCHETDGFEAISDL